MMMKETRGMRNNNPLNIKYVKKNRWAGRVDEQQKRDPLFEEFKTMAYGLRAAIALLRKSYIMGGFNTVRLIVGRWCPPDTSEHNNTKAYVSFVEKEMQRVYPDMTADTPIRWWDAQRIYQLVRAMALVECGYKVSGEAFMEAWKMLETSRSRK